MLSALCHKYLDEWNVSSTQGWHAFVDYAHTPDALEQSLREAFDNSVQVDCGSCLDVAEIEIVKRDLTNGYACL